MKQLLSFVLLFAWSNLLLADLSEIVEQSGITGGIVVHLNCGDGKETSKMLFRDNLLVHGLDASIKTVGAARERLSKQGLYGKISISHFDGEHLPYADNLVNLIVADKAGKVSKEEILRVLVPKGTAYIGGETITKPWSEGIDEWGHFLHAPDNNAVVKDSHVGLPRALQWVGGKPWARSHEELSTISATVSSGGRLFYIVDQAPTAYISFNPKWMLVARDAFNGSLLWEKPIEKWNDHMREFRSGPSHLPRRLVADGDKVYVTLGLDAPLSQLDAATGETLQTYMGTDWCEELLVKDGILYVLVGSSEANRFGEGLYQKNEPPRTDRRFLAAIEAKCGRELWRRNAKNKDFILPMGIAISEGKLYYHSVQGLGCLDALTGKEQWLVERPTIGNRYGFSTSTLVATPEVVLLADLAIPNQNKAEGKKVIAETDIAWGVGGWSVTPPSNDLYLERKGKSELTAYSTKDGEHLWSVPCGEGYNSPADVFVVNDLVWVGPFTKKKDMAIKEGYDLRTGEVIKTIDMGAPNVGMAHDRCYRNKASEQFIFTCRDGIELHDYETGWIRNNSWTRGPCQLGIMPCNGLMYVPTDPCACHLKMRMPGFKSYSSQKLASVGKPIDPEGRLIKGTAYDKAKKLARLELKDSDWPLYRHDIQRSGYTAESVEVGSKPNWTAQLGGTLTQPVYAHGKVYVASSDQLTVYALDGMSGKIEWKYMAGSTIDSAPTVYNGMLVFGSGDGRVHCVDASSGDLVWCFRAAPEERLISVYGRLESSWPVHGSVIVKNDELCFTSGSNSYLGGGIYYYRLNPISGKLLASNVVTTIDPVTERQTVEEESGFDSVGVSTDILSSNGEVVFLKHLQIDDSGEHAPAQETHLFSPTSLLEEDWFIRTYWTYSADIEGAGWGGWTRTANNNPQARILSFNNDTVFGYGRVGLQAGRVGHRSNSYHLFSSVKHYERPQPPERKKGERKPRIPTVKKTFNWSELAPFTVRAMVATPDKLIVAGVPDLGRRPEQYGSLIPSGNLQNLPIDKRLEFADPDAALEAFTGERGAYLRLVNAENGELQKDLRLDSVPVNDGMSVSDNRLFISMKDGSIACYGR